LLRVERHLLISLGSPVPRKITRASWPTSCVPTDACRAVTDKEKHNPAFCPERVCWLMRGRPGIVLMARVRGSQYVAVSWCLEGG